MLRYSTALALVITIHVMGLAPLSAYGQQVKQVVSQPVEILDVQKVRAEDSKSATLSAIKKISPGKPLKKIICDVLIAGGGIGGTAAALQVLKAGRTVCLIEETDWLGGQMTSQGVSALDENYLVDTSGASLNYQSLRKAIRSHYVQSYRLSEAGRMQVRPTSWTGDTTPLGIEYFNPGNCWVSWLAFEPKVALAEINKLLKPFIDNGELTVLLRNKVLSVGGSKQKAQTASVVNLNDGSLTKVNFHVLLDATECGDILPLAGIDYVSGAESNKDTKEAHAPDIANPDNVQDFVYPFVVEYCEGENHTIAKPAHYESFVDQNKYSFDGYKMFADEQIVDANGKSVKRWPFWSYRRLIDRTMFTDGPANDLAMINWSSNDLRGMNIIDKDAATAGRHLAMAKSLSLGFLYWLQTEAPRDDGGKGYPELKLRFDILDTDDGLSKYPYIRESRRILAKKTIVEQDIAYSTNQARAKLFTDAVGIGLYPIDIHGHQDVAGAGQHSRPFQIPLGALLTRKASNVIPANKNIGTTHITNGAYRLHPVEWAIGEAAGVLAGYAVKEGIRPEKALTQLVHLRKLQVDLLGQGIPVFWYSDIATVDPDFAAIQFLSVIGALSADCNHLRFDPDSIVSRDQALAAVNCVISSRETNGGAIVIKGETLGELTLEQLAELGRHRLVKKEVLVSADDFKKPVTKRVFAAWLYKLALDKKYFGRI